MYTIGEFSRATALTIKTLRFYHEQGLLDPTHVDSETGYRYYDVSKIETARIITYLRSLDLTLEEIGEIARRGLSDIERQMRQQVIDQVGLMAAELVALAAAEERAACVRGGAIVRRPVAVTDVAR